MRKLLQQHPLSFVLVSVALLGTIGILYVNILRFNFPVIRSDGLGYYLYLPATFIYRDLGLQSVAELFRAGSIPDVDASLWRDSGPALWEGSGNYLIKYPMGVAVLMIPFFCLACLLALITGSPLDGFSPLFQYVAAFSGLAYTLAGVALLWKVLEAHFKQSTILIAMLGLLFGTNLFHYATYDSVFSHNYSFFLFSAFLYAVQRVYAAGSRRYFLLAGILAGLIVLTRPTNILWLIFGLGYGVSSASSLKERLHFWKEHTAQLAQTALCFALVVSLQLAYWKFITGRFVVFSYRGEHFNFASPEILNVLFSVRKGLFFWAPLLLTAIPGLWFVRRRAPEYFLAALVFLPLNVYVISSWHSWFYGGSFGHRAFIESLPLFAVCFCALYEQAGESLRRGLAGYTALCMTLSSWLMLKYWTGAIPFDGTTWEYFVGTFFNLFPTR